MLGGIGTAVNIAEQMQDAIDNYGLKDEFLGFAFDNENFGEEINEYPILGKTREVWDKYGKHKDVYFMYQLYRPDKIKERAGWLPEFKIPTERFYNFIHPTALISKSVKIGFGNAIQAGTVLGANVVMGNHNTFNSTVLLGHNTTIGDHNFFAAHSLIGSNIQMGNYVFLGLNAALNNMITIGDNIMVAMGSNVIKSLESNQLVMGTPAKKIKNI
jgi:UDP-3-O-[3-hydroxymyristoyl] glucosamine N-acyltransferase